MIHVYYRKFTDTMINKKKKENRGKAEIARYDFSFFSLYFPKSLWFELRLLVGCIGVLTHYQKTNFRLFQTERVCRRQFQIWWKWQNVIQAGRKHCGKRRNCSLRAISPFPTVFFKCIFPRGVKWCYCVEMGFNSTLTAKVISWRSVTHICFLAFSHQY